MTMKNDNKDNLRMLTNTDNRHVYSTKTQDNRNRKNRYMQNFKEINRLVDNILTTITVYKSTDVTMDKEILTDIFSNILIKADTFYISIFGKTCSRITYTEILDQLKHFVSRLDFMFSPIVEISL